MANITAARLDPLKMRRIKSLILSKFGGKRSFEDKDA